MIHSLQFRLMLAFILVIVVTIGGAFFLCCPKYLESELQQYEETSNQIYNASGAIIFYPLIIGLTWRLEWNSTFDRTTWDDGRRAYSTNRHQRRSSS